MRRLSKLTLTAFAFTALLLVYPETTLAACFTDPAQVGPFVQPVSCSVGGVTYWCTTGPECQALQNAPQNNGLGSFSSMFGSINQHLINNSSISSPNNFLGNALNLVMPFIFVLAGLGMLAMLIAGGFQIMTAVQDPNRAEEGKQRIVAAFVGFFILFAAYWLIQVLEIIFGFKILG